MWWSIAAAVYLVGFVFTFWLNATSGPLTFGLVLLRSFLWFIWMATGWPHGTPLRMD